MSISPKYKKIFYWILAILIIAITVIISAGIISAIPYYILVAIGIAIFLGDELMGVSNIKEHDIVVLKTDLDYAGIKKGETGTVIHIYPDAKAYEVEFSNPIHTTVTVLPGQIKKQSV